MPVSFDFDADKAVDLILYLASREEDVTAFDRYKAAKLIFLADKLHLVLHGRPITGDEYKALDYGPIPQRSLDLLGALLEIEDGSTSTEPIARLQAFVSIDRSHRYPRFSSKGLLEHSSLSRSEIVVLDHIISQHGRKDFPELLNLTHATAAYRRAWESRTHGAKTAPMHYEDFFEEDSDAVEGAFEEMIENDALRKAFPSRVGI